MTNVPKIPPTVEKLLAIGPIILKPPKIINKGIRKTSAMAINHDEITGKSEKNCILRIKLSLNFSMVKDMNQILILTGLFLFD